MGQMSTINISFSKTKTYQMFTLVFTHSKLKNNCMSLEC